MPSAQRLDEPSILLLPEDLFNNIASWLDDQELCNMELTNKDIRLLCQTRASLGLARGGSTWDNHDLITNIRPANRPPGRQLSYSFCNTPKHTCAAVSTLQVPFCT